MHIIPVIDLLNGVVVHAKKGNRSQYQPIQSSLTPSSYPVDIVKAFMDLYPFKTLYIADLNAIQQIENTGRCHQTILEDIHQAFPSLTIWIDAGINSVEKAARWLTPYTKLVLGSESFQTLEEYQTVSQALKGAFVLSLDFSPQGYLGPDALLKKPEYWPQHVIAMTLSQVGSNAGINTSLLKNIVFKAGSRLIYAAGGVRNINDLELLEEHSVHGVLIASALHNQQLSSADLSHFVT